MDEKKYNFETQKIGIAVSSKLEMVLSICDLIGKNFHVLYFWAKKPVQPNHGQLVWLGL